MSNRQTDMEAVLVQTRAAKRTMRGQNLTTENRIKALKTQLVDARLALEKSAHESSKTEADFSAKTAAAEKLFNIGRVRMKRLERELASKVGLRQKSPAEH